MIEFASTLSILVVVIPSFLALLYLGVAQASIKFVLRQSVTCLSYERSMGPCRAKANRLSQRLLPLGRVDAINLSRNSVKATARIRYTLSDKFSLDEVLTLDLPLKADSL